MNRLSSAAISSPPTLLAAMLRRSTALPRATRSASSKNAAGAVSDARANPSRLRSITSWSSASLSR